MSRLKAFVSFVAVTVLVSPAVWAVDETIKLFNGQDLTNFYIFLKERGRDNDPKQVFTVQDGVLRISGEEWGCVTTNEEYDNFRLIAEYKWGDEAFPPREDRARDGGILIHSVGEDGGYSGIWMHSIEVQLIEGGTGDFIVVGDKTDKYTITCPVRTETTEGGGQAHYYDPDGEPVTINGGRINWWGRDPEWEDVINFRGAKDVEKPIGEWNTLECIADGNTITVILNGVVVNRAIDCKPTRGRIQVQAEGAEIFLRRLELQPLAASAPGTPDSAK